MGMDIVGTDEAPTVVVRSPDKATKLAASDLVGILLMYCRQQAIPVPQRSQKMVQRSAGGLTLVLTTDRVEDGTPVVSDDRISYVDTSVLEELKKTRHDLARATVRLEQAERKVAEANARADAAEKISAEFESDSAKLTAITRASGLRGLIGRRLVHSKIEPGVFFGYVTFEISGYLLQRKRGGPCGPPPSSRRNERSGLEIHIAHATHSATTRRHRRALLLRLLGDHGFGRHQQAGHRGGVLQRGAHDLGRVDDAGLHQVLELTGLGVVAVVVLVLLQRLAGDHRAVFAGVLGDLAQRGLDRLADDLDAEALVVIVGLQLGQDQRGARQGDAAARDDAFLDRPRGWRAGCRQRGPCAPSLPLRCCHRRG